MNEVLNYVTLNLSRELEEVKKGIQNQSSILSIEEQTLIYKYTEDGYLALNEKLRISRGKEVSKYGKLLAETIAKLPDYRGVVFRAADLTRFEIKKYEDLKEKNRTLVEHSFISGSRLEAIAYQFGKNCLFIITSRSGKSIEEFAKYGINHPQNEKEVLFSPNLTFSVLDITKQERKTLITLEEIEGI